MISATLQQALPTEYGSSAGGSDSATSTQESGPTEPGSTDRESDSATSTQESGPTEPGSGDGGSGSGRPILCSIKGNCSCLFKRFDVTVRCTSVGNKLDEIASELPSTTTHL